jgi:hypothetical protein
LSCHPTTISLTFQGVKHNCQAGGQLLVALGAAADSSKKDLDDGYLGDLDRIAVGEVWVKNRRSLMVVQNQQKFSA